MALTSLLSVLSGHSGSDDMFQTALRGRQTRDTAAAQLSLTRGSRTTTEEAAADSQTAADRFGQASSVSLSRAARSRLTEAEKASLKEEALKRANATLGRSGNRIPVRQTRPAAEPPKPADDAPVADKMKYTKTMLEKSGADGKALNEFLGKFFDGVKSTEGTYLQDRLQGLMLRLNSPSRDLTSDIQAARAPQNAGKQVFTLVGKDNSRLRVEYTKGADGKGDGSLRLTYSGRDIGAVDMRLTKKAAVPPATQPTLDAQVVQRRFNTAGRLESIPIYDSKYNGPL